MVNAYPVSYRGGASAFAPGGGFQNPPITRPRFTPPMPAEPLAPRDPMSPFGAPDLRPGRGPLPDAIGGGRLNTALIVLDAWNYFVSQYEWAKPLGSTNGWTKDYDCARTPSGMPRQATLSTIVSSPGVGLCQASQTLNPNGLLPGAVWALLPARLGYPAGSRSWQQLYLDSWTIPTIDTIKWYSQGYYDPRAVSTSVSAPSVNPPLAANAAMQVLPIVGPRAMVLDAESIPVGAQMPNFVPAAPGSMPDLKGIRVDGFRYQVGPVPVTNPQTGITVAIGGGTVGGGVTGGATRAPPGPRTREKKMNAKGGAAAAITKLMRSLAYGATEANDAVSAVYNALPAGLRRRLGLGGGIAAIPSKLSAIYNHLDQLDLNAAIVNLILNEIQDRAIGHLYGVAGRAPVPPGVIRTAGAIERAAHTGGP